MSAHYRKKKRKGTEENDAKHPSQTDSTLEEAHVFFSTTHLIPHPLTPVHDDTPVHFENTPPTWKPAPLHSR